MLLGAYRVALDAARLAVEQTVGRLVLSLYDRGDREASIRALTPALTEAVRSGRREAYGYASEMLRSQAESQGVGAPYVPSRSGYSEASVRSVLEDDLRGSPDEAVQIVAPRLGQHVEDSARQTVVRSVEDGREPDSEEERAHRSREALSPEQFKPLEDRQADLYKQLRGLDGVNRTLREGRAKSWARMLTGAENCGFCVMLASRGPVYSSASTAGRVKASDHLDTLASGYVNAYHTNCDCLVVPVYSFKNWPGREDWKALQKFYKSAIADADWDRISAENHDLAAVEQALRRLEAEGESLPITDLRTAASGAQPAAA